MAIHKSENQIITNYRFLKNKKVTIDELLVLGILKKIKIKQSLIMGI